MLAKVDHTKRVGIASDILSSWKYIGHGVTVKSEKDRIKYWTAWTSYCKDLQVDPFLPKEFQLLATIAATAFAARVRTGCFRLGAQVTVQTVTKALVMKH